MTKSTKGKMGRPAFVPTNEQRNFVAAMVGCRMTHEEICSVLVNPQANRGLDKMTLQKAFPEELAHGKAKLKSLVQSKWIESINSGEWRAVQFGLHHICGFKEERAGGPSSMGITMGQDGEGKQAGDE